VLATQRDSLWCLLIILLILVLRVLHPIHVWVLRVLNDRGGLIADLQF
jgi:hypothetical protein